MLDESSLDAIEISTEKGLKIRVSKAANTVVAAGPAAMPMLQAEVRQTPAGGVPVPAEAEAPAPASNLAEIKSPMVGTYYSAPEPGAKPFVTVGSRVAKGQVLCIIEAMKIFNEITAERAGTIKEIAVGNAEPVEFGQTLFVLAP